MRAPKDFEFTVKAWQLITHEPSSPTYRKAKLKKKLCAELGLIHCVDLFADDSVTQTDFAYFRLHGFPTGKRMHRYAYTEEDLKELYEKCMNMNFSEAYVLFNNDTMYGDALRFMEMVN